jgi:tRNA(Ile)-lysidine synthase
LNASAAPNQSGRTVAVAFSGGRDSLALLHATTRAAVHLGVEVVALHVHHGLMPDADAWLQRARSLCQRWRRAGWPLHLRVRRLMSAPAAGQSVEAWARAERYAALAEMARESGASVVLLAHHRRDQAETVLLQALRGAGPRGLAAMPRCVVRDGVTWARPWLTQPREAIEAYTRRHRLRPAEDPSNRDPRYARSRLRQTVWPALAAAFCDAEQALAAVAERAQESDAALREWVAVDLARCQDGSELRRDRWLDLSQARRVLVLRGWLGMQSRSGASHALVRRLMDEWSVSTSARWPSPGGGEVRAWRQRLWWVDTNAGPGAPGGATPMREVRETLPACLDLRNPGLYPLPSLHGAIEVRAARTGGVAPSQLVAARICARVGGEQFQRGARTVPRSLKKAYQEAGVPAHDRTGPLVWDGGRLLFVSGLGLDARAVAAVPGGARRVLRWIADPA